MKRPKHYSGGPAALALLAFVLSVPVLSRNPVTAIPIIHQQTTAAEEAYFVMEVPPRKDNFVIKLTDPAKIQKARDLVSGKDKTATQVTGIIVKQAACYNPPWSFHYDPDSIGFFDSATEVCDASIAYTESFLNDAGGAFLPDNRWCPWGSRLLREIGTTGISMG